LETIAVHCKYDVLVDPKTLNDHPKNRNRHPKEQIARLAKLHQKFGYRKPIIVSNQSKCIVTGHGNKLAAIANKAKVPVVYQDFESPEIEYAFVQADNASALWSELDIEQIKLDIGDILASDFDLELLAIEGLEFVHPHIRTTENNAGESGPTVGDFYTKKIRAPIYEPKGEKPELGDLVDTSRTGSLIEKIEAADIPDDVKLFLHLAAQRHNVFSYDKVAEYYAHAPPEIQRLMEESALVIIDFEKAIELGFVTLTKEIADAYRA